MSNRKRQLKTTEESILLARTQMADASAALLRATSQLARTLRFKTFGLTSEFPIAATQLTDGCITIEFLYGPTDFQVEIYLSHHIHPDSRLGLAELIQHPPIREWLTSHRVPPPGGIESVVGLYGELLIGPCAEAFTAPDSFFNRFPRNDRNA